jgi:hypothetical protein
MAQAPTILLYLLLAFAYPFQSTANSPTPTASAGGCPAGEGLPYQANITARTRVIDRFCPDGGPIHRGLDGIRRKFEFCGQLNNSVRNDRRVQLNFGDSLEKLGQRLRSSCQALREYQERANKICAEHGGLAVATRAAAGPAGPGQREALLAVNQQAQSAVRGYESLLTKARSNLGLAERAARGANQRSPFDTHFHAFGESLKNNIDGQVGFMANQAAARLAQRERISQGGRSDDPEHLGAIRFRTQADVDAFYSNLVQCRSVKRDLDTVNRGYQESVGKALSNLPTESTALVANLEGRKRQLEDRTKEMEQLVRDLDQGEARGTEAQNRRPAERNPEPPQSNPTREQNPVSLASQPALPPRANGDSGPGNNLQVDGYRPGPNQPSLSELQSSTWQPVVFRTEPTRTQYEYIGVARVNGVITKLYRRGADGTIVYSSR